jgi:hypothetical protein
VSELVRRIAVRPHKVVLHFATIIFCGFWIVAMFILGVPWLGILSPVLLAALPVYMRRFNRPCIEIRRNGVALVDLIGHTFFFRWNEIDGPFRVADLDGDLFLAFDVAEEPRKSGRYRRTADHAVCGMDERRADIYELSSAELAKLLNEQRGALQGANA